MEYYTYDQIYKDNEYRNALFSTYNKNPLCRYDLEVNTEINETNVPENPVQETFQFLFHKWKFFTI